MLDRTRKLKRVLQVLLTLVLALALAGSVSASGNPLSVTMDWLNVVPDGSGDPNALGSAVINIYTGKSQLCYVIRAIFFYSSSTERRAAIFSGPAGQVGLSVIDIGLLVPPFNSDTVTGCLAASALLLNTIQQNLQNYYLQIFTDTHPAGALRGQLMNSR